MGSITFLDARAIRLAAAWEALFVYDTILFVLTLHKTWRERPRRRGIVMTEGRVYLPLLSLILRDGAIYYAVMALANLVNILTFYHRNDLNVPPNAQLTLFLAQPGPALNHVHYWKHGIRE
ncbi:hypothetical protein E1B28_002764 [Marasmius oreades]|uniref:Uncharacterized protein n=1 Tax=Marasmius oreades TaxID=181124 RepID=A0A9P7RPA3_9AGAR|nr:uncharacterized protein E1B28_002764 [Marasmius oreades]KAG7086843.1 hypothetical protein E1B28_002764 [Marasmius oreades]